MKTLLPLLVLGAAAAAPPLRAQPSLTIYNQDFAVVREQVPLELRAGETAAAYSGVTVRLEPDSVVLRDPAGRVAFRVLEQGYRADTVSEGLLLSLNEGKMIDFLVDDPDGRQHVVKGRIVRSGYTPEVSGFIRNNQQYYQQRMARAQAGTPIVEVDGQLRFSLPGKPLFPALADDVMLKPTLSWKLFSAQPAKFNAELSYLTGGLSWSASYNLVAPEKGETCDLIGWVTLENQSGRTFDQAAVKLMAGNVSKLEPGVMEQGKLREFAMMADVAVTGAAPVTEKAFDEYHLYALPRPVTLHDQETKQVEFIRAAGIKTSTYYVYAGADLSPYRGWNTEMIRTNPDYGAKSNPHVWVMREFRNSQANGLGLPLPQGRVRLYRRDEADGRLEFTGENLIDHTPKDETVKLYAGDAFDLVGERKRTDFALNTRNKWAEEEFEIRLRNHKAAAVEVRVEEKLYRGDNWGIERSSADFTKLDSNEVEFRLTVPPAGESLLTYRVRYSWGSPRAQPE